MTADIAALREAIHEERITRIDGRYKRSDPDDAYILGLNRGLDRALEAIDRWAAAQEPTGAIVGREDVAEAVEEWAQGQEPVTLDAAWAEAEAALPEGWWIHAIDTWSFDDMAYRAEAVTAGSHFWAGKSKREKEAGTRKYAPGPNMAAFGPTPAAALQALATKLRAKL